MHPVPVAPQRPYCTIDSLRKQLLYPLPPEAAARVPRRALRRALDAVQLGALADRLAAAEGGGDGLDAVRDWGDMLSLGEQQRLAFARLLINRPRLAILDEDTSALDLPNEAAMYRALAGVPGLTIVSVGHRPSLLQYHRQLLRLKGADASPCFELGPVVGLAPAELCELEAGA